MSPVVARDAGVLHVRGTVLAGRDPATGELDVRDELWVVGGRVTHQRPAAAPTGVLEGWALPGLVDAHCHVGLGPDGPVDAATTRTQAEADRDAGALLLRDAGSPADTRWLDGPEGADLPRVIRAGRHIARTRRYLRGVADEVEPEQLADALRLQARAGDGWVKVVGDWIDRDAGELAPCWPLAALREAVAVAHAEGARVAVHVFGAAALPDLLEAGVDCLEHGTGLGPETLAAVVQRGVAVTPTLVNTATFPEIAARGEAKFPAYAAQMRALHASRQGVVADAADAGVRLLVGTDAGTVLPHGLVAREVAALVGCGLSTLAALDAATWGARAYLGAPVLAEGDPADLVVLGADPREDVGALAHPRAVVLRGRVVAA